ncbi:pectinesterase [Dorcoceras hygrometricum]|uniref:Pectinesterase n=1 Tax=Dorcoceras hygrometricum TaxID=472368 RepID=A0A2Z7C4U7_9LAMI|nr:pectinesterase [Dorcoceras hygrometricum]
MDSKLPLLSLVLLALIPVPAVCQIQADQTCCQNMSYPDLCAKTVESIPEHHRKTLPEIISATINVSMAEITESASNCSAIRRKIARKLDPIDLRALDDCLELFSRTISQLRKVLADLSTSNSTTTNHYYDLPTLLSGTMTNQAAACFNWKYGIGLCNAATDFVYL